MQEPLAELDMSDMLDIAAATAAPALIPGPSDGERGVVRPCCSNLCMCASASACGIPRCICLACCISELLSNITPLVVTMIIPFEIPANADACATGLEGNCAFVFQQMCESRVLTPI